MKDWFKSLGAGTVIFLSILLVAAIVSIGGWAFSVATSDIKGRGDVVRKTNDADNRIFAQENFHQRYQDILASDKKLDQAAADKAANPTDVTARTQYTGLVNYCLSIVGEYNTDARRITRQKFLDADLPAQIDAADPATDCKESSK